MDQVESIKINSYQSGIERRHIIPLTFLLSVVIHIIAFICIQGVLPDNLFSGKLRNYKVDLIMPSSEEPAENKKNSLPDNKQIKGKPQTQVKEATISLDTDDEIYVPYAGVIKERIFYHWVYPLSAKNRNMQGDLLIALRLDNNGNLIECNVIQPSKYKILDEHALKAISLANPFPPFPENIVLDFLNINASFSYQLNFK